MPRIGEVGMRFREGLLLGLLMLPALTWCEAAAQECRDLTPQERTASIEEHVYGGLPSEDGLLVRRGYVTAYDSEHRVPDWSAWHATADFLDPPIREGRWAKFREDPDVEHPVNDDDYDGLLDDFDYARGHIVPYFISGGDRDDDGRQAERQAENNPPINDLDDACVVFEINYMTNIAPQLHSTFNGSGGLWFALETAERAILKRGVDLHIIAGTHFRTAIATVVGPEDDIFVPHLYYRLVIAEQGVVVFLFVHEDKTRSKGCKLNSALEECIVTVADIETLTGLDFFHDLDDDDERRLEGTDGRAVWRILNQGS